ncbi:hypothetical protein PMX22_17105 [Clostridium butyricum]|uniref:hypothetical protein n=1 Tax=Clostridium butyricum TaxID=1492 RepID=UPI00232EA34D|nr:hypothetical protein [Clostridium butyricum]MDB2161512.1 hypothetical protein [Clostridium butyricum]
MSYVDEDYYNSCSDIIKEKLSVKLEKATDQINSLTYNRIIGKGFDNLTPFQQDKIKKAICVHADFIEQYGPYIDMPLSGFSAGSVNVSFNAQKINGVTTTQEVLNYLNSTGLSCRRI